MTQFFSLYRCPSCGRNQVRKEHSEVKCEVDDTIMTEVNPRPKEDNEKDKN